MNPRNGGAQGTRGHEPGQKPGQGHRKVKGGVKKRAVRRSKAVGHIKGVSRKDGITRREAKKIRGVWEDEGKPRPWKKGGGKPNKPNNGNAPASLTDPLTPKTLKREVNTSADLRYGGELRQLDNEIRGSDRRSNEEIPAWFQSFINTAGQAQQSAQGAWQGAQQNVLTAANEQYGRAQGVNAQHLAGAQQDAAVSGTTANLQPYQQAEQAAQARHQAGVGEAGMVGSLGAADTSNIAMQQVIGAQKMLEALNSEGRARGVLRGEKRGVVKEKGQYKTDLRRQMRSDEREWSAVQKEFGLDVLSQQQDAANDAADNKLNRRKEKRERKQDRWDRRQDRAKNKLDNKKYMLSVSAERRQRLKDLADDGRTNSSSGGGGGNDNGGGPNQVPQSERSENKRRFRSTVRSVARGQLTQAEAGNLDPLLVDAAKQVAYWRKKGKNGVSSKKMQRRLWSQFGIRVPVVGPGPHDIGATPSPLGPK